MKLGIYIIIGILSVIFTIFAYFTLPWVAIYFGTILQANPPQPEIKYGEFPFKLTYGLKGETKVIEDTVICEFDGYVQGGEAGSYRKWKSHLKSGNPLVTLLKVDETMELFFDYGDPEFYMDDPQHGRTGEKYHYDPNIIEFMKIENGQKSYSGMLVTEAWEKYKIKIISCDYAKPIKNSFYK